MDNKFLNDDIFVYDEGHSVNKNGENIIKNNSQFIETNIVTTMKSNINSNAIWCSTFQLLWKDFQFNMLENNFSYNKENALINDLISTNNEIEELNEKDFYKAVGKATVEFKEKIENDIKEKFNEQSDILKDLIFDADKDTNKILLYAMFKKEFPFKYQFEDLGTDTFGKNQLNVEYFGMNLYSTYTDLFKRQVKVLFYNDENDYAIMIHSQTGTNVVLYRNSQNKNFAETFSDVLTKTSKNRDYQLNLEDRIKIPKLEIDIKKSFEDLIGEKFIKNSDEYIYTILKALQTINLELNEKGGKVNSEAALEVERETAVFRPYEEKEQRFFDFNDTFYMFLLESSKQKPYLAVRIANIDGFRNNNEKIYDEEYIKKCLAEIMPEVTEFLKMSNMIQTIDGKDYPVMGYCHHEWALIKQIMKERYNIDWKSPQDEMPWIDFD